MNTAPKLVGFVYRVQQRCDEAGKERDKPLRGRMNGNARTGFRCSGATPNVNGGYNA